MPTGLKDLPCEVLTEILFFADIESILAFKSSCSYYNSVPNDSFWHRKLLLEYPECRKYYNFVMPYMYQYLYLVDLKRVFERAIELSKPCYCCVGSDSELFYAIFRNVMSDMNMAGVMFLHKATSENQSTNIIVPHFEDFIYDEYPEHNSFDNVKNQSLLIAFLDHLSKEQLFQGTTIQRVIYECLILKLDNVLEWMEREKLLDVDVDVNYINEVLVYRAWDAITKEIYIQL